MTEPIYDKESLMQLRVIELENKLTNLNREVSNILTRLKIIDDQKLSQELQRIDATLKIHKILLDELNKIKLSQDARKDAKDIKEMEDLIKPKSNLAERIKKIINK